MNDFIVCLVMPVDRTEAALRLSLSELDVQFMLLHMCPCCKGEPRVLLGV